MEWGAMSSSHSLSLSPDVVMKAPLPLLLETNYGRCELFRLSLF